MIQTAQIIHIQTRTASVNFFLLLFPSVSITQMGQGYRYSNGPRLLLLEWAKVTNTSKTKKRGYLYHYTEFQSLCFQINTMQKNGSINISVVRQQTKVFPKFRYVSSICLHQ